jgi:hypothetical protein
MNAETEPLQIKWKLFRPWLEGKKDDHWFTYGSNDNCLICQFVRETHGEEVEAGGTEIGRSGELVTFDTQIPREIAFALTSKPSTVKRVKEVLNDPATSQRLKMFRTDVYGH